MILEPVQRNLLSSLAKAARNIPENERVPFSVTSQLGKRSWDVHHPGLPDQTIDAYSGDLRVLEAAGLILVGRRTNGNIDEFDVTPAGFSTAGMPAFGPRQWGRWTAVDDVPHKRSAMSNIWRVKDSTTTERTLFALKEMRYQKSRGSTAYQRFVREIETLAKGLSGRHPGIVDVLDYAVPREGDDSDPYYVMPLAPGSLQQSKAFRSRLEMTLELGLVVADALEEAHKAGVIHRDIKPGNILLFGDEMQPAVCDFGICYLEDEDRLTGVEGETVGTRDFVAPELHGGGQSENVTPAADVYSLGKTLFAAVSGGDVFPREWLTDSRYDLAQRFNDPRLNHLTGLMELMVTESPAARLQSMGEVRGVLERALENLRGAVPYVGGMYTTGLRPIERLRQLQLVLRQPHGVSRMDSIRQILQNSIASAQSRAIHFEQTNRDQVRVRTSGTNAAVAAVAAASAEELLSTGLPLVMSDERDVFEEWLGLVLDPNARRDGNSYAINRLILSPAGVLSAYVAAALAWKHRRLEILRMVLDRASADGSSWLHHDILDRNSSDLEPWISRVVSDSETVKSVDPALAREPVKWVRFVSGLIALRFLRDAPTGGVQALVADPVNADFPTPFAPGFIHVSWVADLLEMATSRPPLERDMARLLFDLDVKEFRALIKALTAPLASFHQAAMSRLGRAPYFSLGVDLKKWGDWCGYQTKKA